MWGVDLVHERRLVTLAALYAPLAAGGAWLSLRYGVGALPGGDPARDLAFRGTGLAPPLFLPVALLGAAALSRRSAGAVMASVWWRPCSPGWSVSPSPLAAP